MRCAASPEIILRAGSESNKFSKMPSLRPQKIQTSAWRYTSPGAETRMDKAIHQAMEQAHGSWEGPTVLCSRNKIQSLIESGAVTVNGKKIRNNTKLKAGDQIEIAFPLSPLSSLKPESHPSLPVLFEDAHLMVLNKPAGLTVHPSPSRQRETLVQALLFLKKPLSQIGGPQRPGIVHRIDKDTTGAMVIAKTDSAHQKLVQAFSAHSIQRTYWALCYGAPPQSKGTIRTQIGRNPLQRKKMTTQVKAGKTAITHYEVLERFPAKGTPYASWVQARLETGRTHQVRVHLTSIGCSLLGDPLYGTPAESQLKWKQLPEAVRHQLKELTGQALHAKTLGFTHPETGTLLNFEALADPRFESLLRRLQDSSARTS